MSGFDWLPGFLARLEQEHVPLRQVNTEELAPAQCLELDAEDWSRAARIGASFGCRFVGVWGDQVGQRIIVRACLETAGDYLVLTVTLPIEEPVLGSLAPWYPGADRLERHLHDLLGVTLLGQTEDPRRWTRHQAWHAGQFPLRHDFPVAGQPPRRTPSDTDYPFDSIQGSGVYEIPVGPVHAGIIEPGHFRFQAVGEEVLRLEERFGYVHKGIEKIAVGRDPAGLARLAGRVSGDSTVAHGWAACQAMERACGFTPSARALHLRAVLCERERIANHLGDIGAICNDVAFVFAHVQCARLREQWQRRSQLVFGHRLLMDQVIPGGVATDLSTQHSALLRQDHGALRLALEPLFDIIDDHPSLEDRLLGTGILSPEDAQALGCTGYVGKASGQSFDVRASAPYSPYDGLDIQIPVEDQGDVAARVRVRMAEIHGSLDLLDRLLSEMPEGVINAPMPTPESGAVGLGLVDGWRGEILSFVRFDSEGRIARFFPRDPSWFTWLALERLIHGNIVPDFPVCNKSVNASYSGSDL